MSAIYLVETPAGQRLIHAGSKAVAINFAVRSSVTAKTVTAAELHRLTTGAQALKVEEAVTSQAELPDFDEEDQAPATPKTATKERK